MDANICIYVLGKSIISIKIFEEANVNDLNF